MESTKFKIPRTVQCAKCPWKVSTDPNEIPQGYSADKHRNLSCTIATEGNPFSSLGKAMACHHSSGKDGMYCVGWLDNQLGEGNNIPLRLKMLDCENIGQLRTAGKQHRRFEDTLPTK